MTYTFFELLKDILVALGHLTVFTASGGSADTAEDAARAGSGRDGDWQGATLFVLAAGDAAPQGEWAGVSGYTASSGTFAVSPAFSAAVGAGDTLGLAAGAVPLGALVELANAGLRGLGEIPVSDDQTLASGAREYELPQSWGRPLMVEVALPGGGWQTLRDWACYAGTLEIRAALPARRALRVTWLAPHPPLALPADVLDAALAPELAVAAGAESALAWLCARHPGDAALAARWETARGRRAEMQRAFPIRRPRRLARLLDSRSQPWA